MNPSPKKRATIPEIHQHPWFTEFVFSFGCSGANVLNDFVARRDNPLLRADEGTLADAIAASLKQSDYMDVVHPPQAPAPGVTDKWEDEWVVSTCFKFRAWN